MNRKSTKKLANVRELTSKEAKTVSAGVLGLVAPQPEWRNSDPT